MVIDESKNINIMYYVKFQVPRRHFLHFLHFLRLDLAQVKTNGYIKKSFQ